MFILVGFIIESPLLTIFNHNKINVEVAVLTLHNEKSRILVLLSQDSLKNQVLVYIENNAP